MAALYRISAVDREPSVRLHGWAPNLSFFLMLMLILLIVAIVVTPMFAEFNLSPAELVGP